MKRHGIVCILFLLAAGGFSQQSVSSELGARGFRGTARFMPPSPYPMTAITGAPYSAEEVHESLQVLIDGTRFTDRQPGTKLFRDSKGRTRTERPTIRTRPGQAQPPEALAFPEILDPVARVRYILDPFNKVAHKTELLSTPSQRGGSVTFSALSGRIGPPPAIPGEAGSVAQPGTTSRAEIPATYSSHPAFSAPPAPESKIESLGAKMIDGILADGERRTLTWPTGALGNDRPFAAVTETWRSRDLKIMILNKTTDPRYGERTHRLTNLSLSEPDPALFVPPPDYQIVEQKGEFTITWEQKAH
jgi:hypothetical protein